jgi:hypothetical protein
MDRKTAKDLLHLRDWLDRAHEIVDRGRDVYLRDDLLQEAGDSLMMKLGEASNRLSAALMVIRAPSCRWTTGGTGTRIREASVRASERTPVPTAGSPNRPSTLVTSRGVIRSTVDR